MNDIGDSLIQIEATLALARIGAVPIEAMRVALVTLAFGTSVELTTKLVYANDEEIQRRFVKQLERTREVFRNELAARWN